MHHDHFSRKPEMTNSKRKQKASKPTKPATTPGTEPSANSSDVELTSANPDPRSWLYKLVQEHNVLHSRTTSPDRATLQGKLDFIEETILAQHLLRAFYNAMKDPEERAKCCTKVDGTTPAGLGGRTGLVKNAFIIATLLDGVTDIARGFAKDLRNGEVDSWDHVSDEMKGKIEKFLTDETAREMAEREGLIDPFDE